MREAEETSRRRHWERDQKSRRHQQRWIPMTGDGRRDQKVSDGSGLSMHEALELRSTSFFFSDFPKNWSIDGMWNHFGRFGTVVDVYVSKKKTKDGRDFGFVRFKGVHDIVQLERDIRGVFIGPNKLQFNVAKFRRKETNLFGKKQVCSDHEYNISPGWKTKLPPPPLGNRTYLEAVVGSKVKCIEAPTTDSKELEWLERCAVGEVTDAEVLNDINHLLQDGGFSLCAAKYIGGFQVLIECQSVESLRKMLDEGQSALREWFIWLEPWSISMESKRACRLVWLAITGVPLHAWNQEVFINIAKEWGEVLEVEDLTASKDQLYISRVCIATHNRGLISESVNLLVNGKTYAIRVLEDMIELMDFGPRYEQTSNDAISSEDGDEGKLGGACGACFSDGKFRGGLTGNGIR